MKLNNYVHIFLIGYGMDDFSVFSLGIHCVSEIFSSLYLFLFIYIQN